MDFAITQIASSVGNAKGRLARMLMLLLKAVIVVALA